MSTIYVEPPQKAREVLYSSLDALKLFSDPRVLRQVIHKDVRLDGV